MRDKWLLHQIQNNHIPYKNNSDPTLNQLVHIHWVSGQDGYKLNHQDSSQNYQFIPYSDLPTHLNILMPPISEIVYLQVL